MGRKNGYASDFANSMVEASSPAHRSPWMARPISSEKIIMQIMHRGNIVAYCLLLMGPAGRFRRYRVCVCVYNIIPVVVAAAAMSRRQF